MQHALTCMHACIANVVFPLLQSWLLYVVSGFKLDFQLKVNISLFLKAGWRHVLFNRNSFVKRPNRAHSIQCHGSRKLVKKCCLSLKRLPRWHNDKESACQCRRHKRCGFNPWVGKIPWSRKWQPTTVFLPGESYGQRSLAGNSPWGQKELNMTKWFSTHILCPWTAQSMVGWDATIWSLMWKGAGGRKGETLGQNHFFPWSNKKGIW